MKISPELTVQELILICREVIHAKRLMDYALDEVQYALDQLELILEANPNERKERKLK